MSGFLDSMLSLPQVYRMWQAPFAERKMQPLLARNDLRQVRRVLDVACGPGTNTHYFRGVEYLGVDWNEQYIRYARRRHGDHFICADVTSSAFVVERTFDFILVNSVLHHLSDSEVEILLEKLVQLLAPGGSIHILELVLPATPSVARALARLDRGKYARSLAAWQQLLGKVLASDIVERFSIRGWGVPLWHMVYFRGWVEP
jgi:SAM-dependent methyltransferase